MSRSPPTAGERGEIFCSDESEACLEGLLKGACVPGRCMQPPCLVPGLGGTAKSEAAMRHNIIIQAIFLILLFFHHSKGSAGGACRTVHSDYDA